MCKCKAQTAILTVTMLLLISSAGLAKETLRLEKGGELKQISSETEDKYLLAVAEIKQLVNTGKTRKAKKAFKKLKKDFPEVAGEDLDAFIKAELLYSRHKYTKAVKAYDKLLDEYPESDFVDAALDRQFSIASAYLAGKKKSMLKIFRVKAYDDGINTMEKISDRTGEAPISIKASLAVAEHYEKRSKFNSAYLKWSEISSRWPTGELGRRALLAMARCKHAVYKGPKFDGSGLVSSRTYYENYALRYPEQAGEIGVDETLKQINEQLAHKQYKIGRYYQRTGSAESANLYYQMVLNNWPESSSAKPASEAMKEIEKQILADKEKKDTWLKKLGKLIL